MRPWVIAAERAGATVRFAEPDRDTLALPPSAIEAAQLSDRTRWVAVAAASNAVGTTPDIAAIVGLRPRGRRPLLRRRRARRPAPAAAPGQLGVDALACSAYKWFGPHVGILCAPPALLEELAPDKLVPSTDAVPHRWELGTLPFEALAATAAAADYVRGRDWDEVRRHEDALMQRALEACARSTA